MIFDEATSSLDSQSEASILNALNEISQGLTTVVIAHRLSTIIDADQILVLDQGRLIEQGNHQQLLEANGKYSELWQAQDKNQEGRQKMKLTPLQLPVQVRDIEEAKELYGNKMGVEEGRSSEK